MPKATDYAVIDHRHDEAAGVYRAVIGVPVEGTVLVVDDAGEPVLDELPPTVESVEAWEQGKAAREAWIAEHPDEDPPPEHPPPPPLRVPRTTTAIVGYDHVRDITFADDDARWLTAKGKRRPDAHVAAEQRTAILEALESRRAPREATGPAGRELPGAGESLSSSS